MQAPTPSVARKARAAAAPASKTGAWSPTKGCARVSEVRHGYSKGSRLCASSLDVCDILRVPKVRCDAVQWISHIDEVPANVDKGEAVGELAAVAVQHRVVPADHGGARCEIVRMRSLDEGKKVDRRRIFLSVANIMSASSK